MSYVALSYWDLLFAAILILVNGLISLRFGLGLEKTLAISTVRMVVQLSLIGFVLTFIFTRTSPLWTMALALVMVFVAGYEVLARQSNRIKGWWSYGLGTTTLLFVGIAATIYAVAMVIGPSPWYAPRYMVPVLGMVLGNMLTGIALVLETLTSNARRERLAIEARIALGAPRWLAMGDVLRQALRTGMMPIINAMAASGLVSLPGMMTGQILSGVEPVDAAKYQIMIMFLIAGSTALGILLAGLGGVWLLTDERHRLRLDRLVTQNR